jgi:hypothetical protein
MRRQEGQELHVKEEKEKTVMYIRKYWQGPMKGSEDQEVSCKEFK